MQAVDPLSRTHWYCVRTQPRREHVAARNLRERVRVDVFAPQIRVARRSRSGAPSAVVEALFPGYIFGRFDYSERFRAVLSAGGVAGIVKFGEWCPTVADDLIELLSTSLPPSSLAGSEPEFAPGAWVRVLEGWFRDSEGRVLSFDRGTERVRVLLSLLGRDVQVSIRARQLVSVLRETENHFGGLIATQTAAAPVVR